ncbi:hypothetical protein, partial [Nocardia sp. NPDC059229]|uniref:hypothetical protein n=1 Tax=Nocardia sp. NPDC059229 TaxID=3346778 RepID=UPI0036A9EE69
AQLKTEPSTQPDRRGVRIRALRSDQDWHAVDKCRPILANDGMQAVQTFLVESGTSTIHAIAITWALLGRPGTPLRAAIDAAACRVNATHFYEPGNKTLTATEPAF